MASAEGLLDDDDDDDDARGAGGGGITDRSTRSLVNSATVNWLGWRKMMTSEFVKMCSYWSRRYCFRIGSSRELGGLPLPLKGAEGEGEDEEFWLALAVVGGGIVVVVAYVRALDHRRRLLGIRNAVREWYGDEEEDGANEGWTGVGD